MNDYFDYVGAKHAKPIDNSRIEVTFQNGTIGIFDCTPYFKDPFWRSLTEPAFFSQVRVEGGTLTWPNDVDIAPEEVWADAVRGKPGPAR